MRDRSGFDLDGPRRERPRRARRFAPGVYLAYTDENHGYGNVGTDNPPAQSPLDAVPEPGSDTPNLDDAAFKQGQGSFSDAGAGHVDNYSDPSQRGRSVAVRLRLPRLRRDEPGGRRTRPRGAGHV